MDQYHRLAKEIANRVSLGGNAETIRHVSALERHLPHILRDSVEHCSTGSMQLTFSENSGTAEYTPVDSLRPINPNQPSSGREVAATRPRGNLTGHRGSRGSRGGRAPVLAQHNGAAHNFANGKRKADTRLSRDAPQKRPKEKQGMKPWNGKYKIYSNLSIPTPHTHKADFKVEPLQPKAPIPEDLHDPEAKADTKYVVVGTQPFCHALAKRLPSAYLIIHDNRFGGDQEMLMKAEHPNVVKLHNLSKWSSVLHAVCTSSESISDDELDYERTTSDTVDTKKVADDDEEDDQPINVT